jgi:hypothetical protein
MLCQLLSIPVVCCLARSWRSNHACWSATTHQLTPPSRCTAQTWQSRGGRETYICMATTIKHNYFNISTHPRKQLEKTCHNMIVNVWNKLLSRSLHHQKHRLLQRRITHTKHCNEKQLVVGTSSYSCRDIKNTSRYPSPTPWNIEKSTYAG